MLCQVAKSITNFAQQQRKHRGAAAEENAGLRLAVQEKPDDALGNNEDSSAMRSIGHEGRRHAFLRS